MGQNRKKDSYFEKKSVLLKYFPISESPSEQKQIKEKLRIDHKKFQDTTKELLTGSSFKENESDDERVLVNNIQEISFEDFLKSRPKKI